MSSTREQIKSTEKQYLTSIQNQENVGIAISREDNEGQFITAKQNPKNTTNPNSMIGHCKRHEKSARTKKRKIRTFSSKDTRNTKKISQIEIYDIIIDDDIQYKSQFGAIKSVETKKMEKDIVFNDNILQKAKRPFYVLIFIIVLFIAVFIMNFIDNLQYFVLNGWTPSTICVISLIPLIVSFRYFEKKIIFQHKIIYRKIKEIYVLSKKLQNKIDETLQQKKYIDDLKLAIKELELSNKENKYKLNDKLDLLHGFRKGQMEIQIEFAEITELINMFNIVISCISLLPFGMTNYRTKLKRILEEKIEKNKYLEMHFELFMFSYLDCIDVKRLFRKHKIMKRVRTRSNHIKTPYNHTIYFKEKDPIKLFRSPIDYLAKVGFTVIVNNETLFDPINGRRCIHKLVVRSIFNSNAKPYLIDCYVGNELSSSFILKKGDDLRKDQSVMQIMGLMNSIWKENEMKYGDDNVECLIYKVIPIGVDCGIIEIVSDCIELNKIFTLKNRLFTQSRLFDRLIASSAASFIASFVCGIRDRHDDNILINTKKCILFHIDYGYIFNDKVSLDTAKFAITSDLKKIFEIYKYGWNDFVKLCVDSWMILRQNASELIDFARVVFAFLYESNEIELFLRDSLKLEMKSEDAKKYITHKIQNAPKKWNTKMKNLVHGFAQKMK